MAAAGQITVGDGTTTVTVAEPASAYEDLDAMVTAIKADASYSALKYTVSAGTDSLVFTAKISGEVGAGADPNLTIDVRRTPAIYYSDITTLAKIGSVAIGDGVNAFTLAQSPNPYGNVTELATAIQSIPQYDTLLYTVTAGSDALIFTAKTSGISSTTPTIVVNSRPIVALYSSALDAAALADTGEVVISDGKINVTLAKQTNAPASIVELAEQLKGTDGYDDLDFTVVAGTDALEFHYKYVGAVVTSPTITIDSRTATGSNIANPPPTNETTRGTNSVDIASSVTGAAGTDSVAGSASDIVTATSGTAGTTIGVATTVDIDTVDVDGTSSTVANTVATTAAGKASGTGGDVTTTIDTDTADIDGTSSTVANTVATTAAGIASGTGGDVTTIIDTDTADIDGTSSTVANTVATTAAGIASGTGGDVTTTIDTDTADIDGTSSTVANTVATTAAGIASGTGGDVTTTIDTDTADIDGTSSTVANTVATTAAGIASGTGGDVTTAIDTDTADIDGTSSTVADTVATTAAGIASGTGGDVTTAIDTDTADVDGTSSTVANTVATTAAGIASGTGGDVTTAIDTDTADVDGTSSTVANTVATTAAGIASGTGGDVTKAIDTDTADVDGTSSTVANTVATTAAGIASGTGGNVSSSVDIDTADVDGTSSTVANTVGTTIAGAESGTGGNVSSSVDTDTSDVDGTSATLANTVTTTTAGAQGASGGVTATLSANTAGVDAGAGAVSTSVSNTTVGADDASQATYTTAAGAISALNSMLDSQGIFFTAAAAGDTGGGSAGITFTADDGTATDGYLATDPTATISGSSAPVTERTAGSDAYSELGFTVSAGEAGGIKMSYKTVGSVDAPTINNAGSSVTVATTTAGVDAEVTAGNVAGNVAARGDISFTGEVAGGDVVTVKINNNSYASFTLDNASASAINSNATHTPDLGGANDATGDPVIAQTAVAGVAAIYTMALNDTAANSLADGFAISDGTTNIAVADMSAVTSVAEVVAAIEADAAYSTLSYAISEAYGGLTFIAKMQTPIASAAEPTGTGLTTAINTAGLAPVAAIKASEGMTFSGNLGFDVGTLSASVVNGKLRVSGSIANDVGTTPTFSMSNIEVSRGVHAPVGGADITTRRLASDALSLLDTAIEGVNTTRAGMGASMSRLDHAVR